VVVVAAREVIAVDPDTGETLWSGTRSEGSPGSAVIEGDVVVHASGSDEQAALVARNLADGRERWRAFLGSSARGGLTAADGVVYVGTEDGILRGVDVESGDEVLRFRSAGEVQGPPAVSDQVVVASWEAATGGVASVRAVDVGSGVEERPPDWQVDLGPAGLPSAAVAVRGGTAYVAGGDGTFRGIDLAIGGERWQVPLRDSASAGQVPAAGSALIVGDRLDVSRVDPATGDELWAYRLADLRSLGGDEFNTLSASAPTVVGDAVVIGDAAGLMSALDVDTGTRVWRMDLGGGAVTALAADGERVYAATMGRDGEVVALEHNPEGQLIEEVSPTVLFPLRAILNFLIAFAVTGLVILAVFRLAFRGRPPPRVEAS
jgi:outer membrane protein assembly factor BamB